MRRAAAHIYKVGVNYLVAQNLKVSVDRVAGNFHGAKVDTSLTIGAIDRLEDACHILCGVDQHGLRRLQRLIYNLL